MGVYYLKHKKHGTKVATDEAEVKHDKERGWEEFDIDSPTVVADVVAAVAKQDSKTLSLPTKEGKPAPAAA